MIQRESSIRFNQSAIEVLSFLATNGYLDGVEIPDWATGGTSVEELINTLKYIGDGEWIAPHFPEYGEVEAVDRWLSDWANGELVPSKSDSASGEDAADDDNETADVEEVILSEYVSQLADGEKQIVFEKFTSSKEYRESAVLAFQTALEFVAAAVVLDNDEFKKHVKKGVLLHEDDSINAIARFCIANNSNEQFELFTEHGLSKITATNFKKRIAACQKLYA